MFPKMIDFERALCHPTQLLRHLKEIQPTMRGRRPALTRTYHAAECRIMLDGKQYMLYMPFRAEMVDRIEALADSIKGIAANFIMPLTILRNEISFINHFGESCSYDLVLQELPEGITLDKAITQMSSENIHHIISSLRNDMQRFYFTHGDLNLKNIIVDTNNQARLIRYWYSEFGTPCRDNFSKLERLIDTLRSTTTTTATNQVLHRKFKDGLIGWDDAGGNAVIPPRYTWATEFADGIAIVAIEHSLGAINALGQVIIPIEYDDIYFDTEKELFVANKDGEQVLIDHHGSIIKRG